MVMARIWSALLVMGMFATANSMVAPNSPFTRIVVPLKMAASLETLHRRLMEVSTPKSSSYGKYLSLEQMTALVGVTAAQENTVTTWLMTRLHADRVEMTATRDVLLATVPASVLEASTDPDGMDLFDSNHALDQAALDLVEFVKVVRPEPPVVTLKDREWNGANTPEGDPNTQKATYGIPTSLNGTHPDNLQMVWGPGTYGYLPSDLSVFYQEFNIPTTSAQVSRLGNKGTPGGDNWVEAALDTDVISGMGLGVHTIVANTNSSQSTEEGPGFGPALLDFTLLLSNMTDDQLPKVLSMSLGSLSWASCNTLCEKASAIAGTSMQECLDHVHFDVRQVCMYPSKAQQDRIDSEFMKLGLRGVTLLGASGDGGSHYSFQPFGGFSALDQALNQVSCELNFPTYPASSAYVTGVGGTTWSSGPSTPSAWGGSGGGFSWTYDVPEYQSAAVQAYLKAQSDSKGFPPAHGFNRAGRGYPDVAALSTNVPIVSQGYTMSVGGTSASTPSFAGIVSLLNGVRLRAGLPVLGFVNPRLYEVAASHPDEAFYDITSGSSACNSGGSCCQTGFPGAKGWDPLTGLGAPRWEGLVKYFTVDA